MPKPQPPKSELEQKEKEQLLAFFKDLDVDALKEIATAIAYLSQAFDGKIPGEDAITRLINPKEILERTHFPTYPLLAKHVYLRLIALYVPEAKACGMWAELEGRALISYHGLGREQYVEMITKTPEKPPETQFQVIGSQTSAIAEPKRRFWQRKPKEQPSEFKE